MVPGYEQREDDSCPEAGKQSSPAPIQDNHMPTVSVIIPSYNHERYIQECIEGVLNQTFQDFEVIITDDASTDRTVELIRSFQDPRIKVFVHDRNRGVSTASNNCINHSRGEFVAIIGSDDAWYPNKLEEQVRYLTGHRNIGAVFGKVEWVDADSRPITDPNFPYYDVFDVANRGRLEWLRHFFYQGNCLCEPCSLVRREVYTEIGMYDPSLASLPDFDLWIRLCLKYDIHVLDERLVRYRRIGESSNVSGVNSASQRRNRFEYKQLLNHYLTLASARELLTVFPEAEKYGRVTKDLIPYFVARAAIDFGADFMALWGLEVLYSFLKDEKIARKVEKQCGFTQRDLTRLAASSDAFNLGSIAQAQRLGETLAEREKALEYLANQVQDRERQILDKDKQIGELNAVITDVSSSASWKITRPLRDLKALSGRMRGQAGTASPEANTAAPFRPHKSTRKNKISVVITAYNHERYIAQCLDSILTQKGFFDLEIILGDDCSTDRTHTIMESYQERHPGLMKMMPNDRNLGVTKNLQRCLEACSGDYIAICEGDDYWTDEYKLQKQMEFLADHPEFSMCFSAFMIRNEEENTLAPFGFQVQLEKDVLSTADLIEENYIGNFSCCMYRARAIREIPREIFSVFTVDWMFNMACGELGPIGFMRERMSVYRKHGQGAWTGRPELEQLDAILPLIDTYNRFLGGKYEKQFEKRNAYVNAHRDYVLRTIQTVEEQRNEPRVAEPDDDRQSAVPPADLLILDTVFPHPLSPFRYQEFTSYLDCFPGARVLTTGEHLPALKEARSVQEVLAEFELGHPEYAGRAAFGGHDLGRQAAKLAYATFLYNIHVFIGALEKKRIPFVFTLYPGGGFSLDEPQSDAKLARVLRSPQFRKVIVTQQVTYDYLVDGKYCTPEQIAFIYGVVTPLETLKDYGRKLHFGFDKKTLDICFVAHKYMQGGIDKGYDVFIAAARQLAAKHDNIRFHVVGNFSEADFPVFGLEGKIKFYGQQNQAWFDGFYRDKDIVLSPNKPFTLLPGTFDGFPAASSTEAGLRKVAIFSTDELNLNIKFTDRKELVIVPPSGVRIAETVEHYYAHPAELKAIAENGCTRIREVYSYENQIAPRIRILQEELERTN